MKITAIAILVAVTLVGGALMLTQGGSLGQSIPTASNVMVAGGKQVVEIRAKGGYLPRQSAAKAGIPTILRFNTNGTFDCSSWIRIPSLNVSTYLPPSGATDIALGSPQPGTLQGSCGMGMYPFEIDFRG